MRLLMTKGASGSVRCCTRVTYFGKDTSIWTLDLAAEVSVTVGLVSRPITGENRPQCADQTWRALETGKTLDYQS